MKTEKMMAALEESGGIQSLEVRIQGLSLSHFDKDSKWKVFFPKAPRHAFSLTIQKNHDGSLEKEWYFRFKGIPKIEVITDAIEDIGKFSATGVESIPNLSALHEGKEIVLLDDPEKFAGFLTLNQGTLIVEPSLEKETFNVWKTKETENFSYRESLFINKEVGIIGFLGFNVDDGKTTEIRLNGEILVSLDHNSNITYQLIFDNDCQEPESPECQESDFKYYYDIIDISNLDGFKIDLELTSERDDDDDDNGENKGDASGVCGTIFSENLQQNHI